MNNKLDSRTLSFDEINVRKDTRSSHIHPYFDSKQVPYLSGEDIGVVFSLKI